MITCPACRTENQDGKNFCKSCGATLAGSSSPRLCPDCGAEIGPATKFCKNCGRPLAPEASAAAKEARPNDPEPSVRAPRPDAVPPERPKPAPAQVGGRVKPEVRDAHQEAPEAAPSVKAKDRPRRAAAIGSALLLVFSLPVLIKSIGILIVHGPLRLRHADVPISWLLLLVTAGLDAAAVSVLRRRRSRRR